MTIQVLNSPLLSYQSPGVGYQPPKPPGTFWEKSGGTIGSAIGSGMLTGGSAAFIPAASVPALTLPSLAAGGSLGSTAIGMSGLGAGLGGSLAAPATAGAASAAVPTAAVLGTPLGPLGVAAIGIAGAIVGSLLDELFGSSPQKAPKYTPPKPTFQPGTSSPSSSGGLGDPGSAPVSAPTENIRLAAASNMKNKMFG